MYCLKEQPGFPKIVDTTIDNVNYTNNPYVKNNPYWAKRIEVEV